MDLYSIGEMLIDFIPGESAFFGADKASDKTGSPAAEGVIGSDADVPVTYIRTAGGAPANVAFAVRKNGFDSGMNCKVGDDDFGRFLMDTLKENGVRVLNPGFCRTAVTTMAFVTLSEDGDRSFTFARKPGADMFINEDDVSEDDIRASKIVHAGSFSLSAEPAASATIKAMRLARELGKLASFDVNYRDLVWGGDRDACIKRVSDVLPYVDLLKISEDEADMIGLSKNTTTTIVETLGANGARAYFNNELIEVPGRKAVCVDATGAGDAFWGGFLSSLLIQGVEAMSDLTPEIIRNALNYGNVAGWLCVQSKGAIRSLPVREEIEKYL